MQVYCCDLTLHDYLFFATTERGKVAETGPFLHNYALTYALGWATSPWHNEVQKPHYREELAQVERCYVTPATLVRGSYLTTQYNTMSESYALSRGGSTGYPDWGFIKCFRPGAKFRFYVISAEVMQFPQYIRLGKFMSKSILFSTLATEVRQRLLPFTEQETKRYHVIHPLLTSNDLPVPARPVIYDIIANSLPSRLIEHAMFADIEGPYLAATFADEEMMVQFPARMGYYGANLCSSW
ncbi:MAG: type I-D CRISPR-associated protein Cas5/Csc1 [Ktedonobacteraceae bacterium]